MKKYVFIIAVLTLLPISLLSQTFNSNGGEITIGVIDTIYSKILGEERPIWISVPRSARNPDKTFPVLYLLDGDAHFYSIAGLLRQLSISNGNTLVPETIIVGIPNTNRTRDLTPSAVSYLSGSGGADQFTEFLENELFSFVEEQYPTTKYRTLVGHSWGGLFVLNTLIYHPALFDNYVAIDPTVRWNNLQFLAKTRQMLSYKNLDLKALFLGVANRLPKGLDLSSVNEDTTKSSEHMRSMLQLVEASERANGLNFNWKFYPNDNHNGVPMIAGYDAMRFLFDWYPFNEEVLFDQSIDLDAKELLNMIADHFVNISGHFGYEFLPPEWLVNRFGDIVMSQGQFVKANALYALNIKNYPESADVYDAMGDYYRRTDNTEKAIEFYRQSLAKTETARTQRKLTTLLENK